MIATRSADNPSSDNAARNGHAANPVLTAAQAYLGAGLSIIPIRPDGNKRPTLSKWDRFQAAPPWPEQVAAWWQFGTNGIAVIGGRVSGNLETIDIDRGDLFSAWQEMVEAQAPGLVARLCVVRTPREPPGYHVRYRCSAATIPGNLKLAQEPGTNPKTGKPTAATLIETRGEGGYALAPGSPPACHSTGRTYEHISGPPLTELPDITPEDREILIASARSFDLLTAAAAGRKKPKSAAAGGTELRPGEDFNQRATWEEVLEPHGWSWVGGRGDVALLRRPGKDTPGHSATLGYCKAEDGGDLLAVFSSDASPFPGPTGGRPCSCHSKFDAYTLLNHNGDYKAAAKALAAQGYGQQRRSRKGTTQDNADQSAGGPAEAPDDPMRSYRLILTHFRNHYEPTFRRSNALYSSRLGREVKPTEACFAPGDMLLEFLREASDNPREEGAKLGKRSTAHKLFKLEAPSAWKDLLATLPEEEQSGEISGTAQEQFRAKLTAALAQMLAISHTYKKGSEGEERTVVERRSAIDWCRAFAKSSRWGGVRTYSLWARWDSEELRLRVALRASLFDQMHFMPLAGLTQTGFTKLAELYGCGESCKVNGGDTRAVELAADFLAEQLYTPESASAGPTEPPPQAAEPPGQTDALPLAPACAVKEPFSCPGEEQSYEP